MTPAPVILKGSSTRGEFTSYKPAFLQAAHKLAQCTHRTRLKAAFKKALEKVDSAGDFTRHSPAFERFRFVISGKLSPRESYLDIETTKILGPWVAWWLEHRTPDRKAWVRCPMPPNTLRVHTDPGTIDGVTIYRPFGEFRRANSYCHLYAARGLDLRQLQETKLPVRLINTTNERRLVQGHETPRKVKGDIEDVSSELDNVI
ncbi:hypothetical protein TNCV_346071 [Trichonephila clavipes]|nr:hypothetical protein TNCV_346071 [Trichonephila clavipes]